MQSESSSKILFIVNPISGGNSKEDITSGIEEYFKPLDHEIKIHLLEGNNDAQTVKALIIAFSPHCVVAVGGDGTVSLVSKLLLRTSMCLGILPAGSANGMAKELQISPNIVQALEIIVAGKVKACDVIQINDQICLHLSDIGMNAQLIKYFDEGKLRGKMGYARMALKVLWNRQKLHVTMQVSGEEVKCSAFMVVLANANKYGFGAVINPDGNLHDGLFEVIMVRKLSFVEFLKMWVRPFAFNPEKIEIFHTHSVRLHTSRKVHFQVDGEYLGKVQNITAKILPAQLNIILPRLDN